MTKRIQLDRTKLLGFRLDPTNTSSKIGTKFGTKAGGKPNSPSK